MDIDKTDYLKKIELFSSLSEKELQQISEMVSLKKYNKNEIILLAEDTNQFMYIIIFGRVKVFHTTQDGKETILAIHGTGEFFGEMALLDGATTPATVTTKDKSLIAIISKKDFYSLLHNQEKIFFKLLQILCRRLRESWKKIQILNLKNAYQRIKLLFSMLAEDHGKKSSDGITLRIKLTHQDIADMAGLTRESVTRVIDRWKREGLITVQKNKYIHLHTEFLKKDFDNVI